MNTSKIAIALIAVGAASSMALANGPVNGTVESFADSNVGGDAPASDGTLGSGRTWTVRPSGVVTGTSGIRFMPIEGLSNGTFASWGMIDFDPTQALAQINSAVAATPGAVGFKITGVTFVAQQQSSQPFSIVGGALDLYHTTNDSFNPALLTGGDYFTNQQLGTLGNEVSQVVNDFAYTNVPSGKFLFTNASANYSSVIDDLNNGTDVIRFILNAGDPTVVAAFKGSSSPFPSVGDQDAPSLRISYSIQVPAPGAMGLFSLAGLAAARRRRA